jgi:putative spermidine/putrescine transport system permease protein
MRISRSFLILLVTPAVLLLVIIFLVPFGWFLAGSLSELGSVPEIMRRVATVVTSNSVSKSVLVTLRIALATTAFSLAIGFPLAYAMTHAGRWSSRIIMACVMLPYFTSVIVRTYALMVVLGRAGIVNRAMQALGITTEPVQLLYNRGAVVLGMTYVLLPYMVLTLYSAMRSIDRGLILAASGMGASAVQTFVRVFLPLTWHGIVAGSLLVFILSIGFFVTPALLGGTDDLMVGMLIERQIELANNWPVAAVMSLLLMIATFAIYFIYNRFANAPAASPVYQGEATP